jgi:putative oxidoreductase
MTDLRFAPYAALLLRLALGTMFLAHSLLKLLVFTLPGTAQFFTSLGLPGWLAYAVFPAEALGGIALIFGIQTRWVALGLLPILIGATWAHWAMAGCSAIRTAVGNTRSTSRFSRWCRQ